jgi:hypothetical protein
VSINIRIRDTSETDVVNTEVLHQRHRVRRVRKVGSELYVPTMMTPASRHLVCLNFVCCTEKVNELVNHPAVCLYLFGTRMSGTSTKVVQEGLSGTS